MPATVSVPARLSFALPTYPTPLPFLTFSLLCRIRPAGALLLACGSDPFQLVDAGVAAAAALSGGAAPRSTKQLPGSLDDFGW
jgi:hypothetical protein